jgi:phosphatidylglycerophosphatase A
MSNLDRNPGTFLNNKKGWTQVTNKRATMAKETLLEKMSSMTKTKVTIMIRVPSDAAADYSAAEVHIATIRELGKQDANMIVLDHKGTSHVNIHKAFGHDKYKEFFQPREKPFRNGSVQVSVAHHILTENTSFNKALLIPFLKQNNVYIFFNQKDGLEHFAAIGVLFGPHPEIAWRQTIVEQMEKTIMAEIITSGDNQTDNSTPKVVLSIVPQQISNPKYNNTKSVALEVRVPADKEALYIEILDRLNERAVTKDDDEVDIVMDETIGTFFPYYAKRNKPELFDLLMRKQNFALNATSAIPLFGYTQQVKDYEIEKNGLKQSVQKLIWNHPNILAIEPTASSATLGKYMILADRDGKEEVEEFIDEIFDTIPDMENQPENFSKPRRGGKAIKKNRISNIPNYLKKLEESVSIDQMLTDDDSEYSASPPARSRRPTISYAQATKRLSFQNETILGNNKETQSQTTNTQTTAISTLTQESLNATLQMFRHETEKSINDLRNEMKNEVKSMEQSIAATVIAAIQSTQPTNMEVEQHSDSESTGVSTHDTMTTMKSMMDRFDALTQIVQQLAQKITTVAETQEKMASKRSRSIESAARQILNDDENQGSNETHSPPTKLQRPTAQTPPTTPPPKGHPDEQGAREER